METIKEEEDEGKGEDNDPDPEEVAAPRFDPMTEGLEGYFNNTAVLTAFQDAILREPGLFRDAIILDLTAALGLFSLWAVRRAGARRAIVVVDDPEDARHAREFARQNKMATRVTVVVGAIEEIELQEEKVRTRARSLHPKSFCPALFLLYKVHFILSDWMGDCLFSRSRLLSLLHARDKYLADSGLLLPDKAALYLSAVTAPYDILEFWNENVCGYDMGCAKPLAVQGRTRSIEAAFCAQKPLDFNHFS